MSAVLNMTGDEIGRLCYWVMAAKSDTQRDDLYSVKITQPEQNKKLLKHK